MIGSFELTREKTHGNSAGHGHGGQHPDREMRVADLGRIKKDVRDVYYWQDTRALFRNVGNEKVILIIILSFLS